MLPAAARIRRRAEFATAVRRGARGSTSSVVVHLDTSAPDGAVRAGFVVGKAVGPAVVRNRVRRRLRHVMAERLPALPAGTRVVVRAHPAAATRRFADLAADVDQAIARSARPGRRGRPGS